MAANSAAYDTTLDLDAYGRAASTFYPDGTREIATFDAGGNRLTLTQRVFASVSVDTQASSPVHAFRYHYDAFNRMDHEYAPGSVVIDYAYDLTGARTSASRQDGAANAWAYDFAGRLASETATWPSSAMTRTVSYTYDRANHRTAIAGDQEIADYDGAGALLRRYVPGPGGDAAP